MARAAWVLVGLYTALSAARVALAVRNWRRVDAMVEPGETSDPAVELVETNPGAVSTSSTSATRVSSSSTREPITVMQPILSGDPALPHLLAENLAAQPEARFLWLVDADDADGRRITAALAAAEAGRVEVLLCPPCAPLTNPKVYKLALGVPRCTESLAVLDDDTVLPPGALDRARTALADADLATGLPWYRAAAGPWAGLVAGFVNGNSLVTYFPLLGFGPPVTINGMFYLTSRSALARAGGFEAILDRACDDYELARLFSRAGLRLAQTTVTHPLTTDVPDARAYALLMHRWMVFASRLLTSSLTAPLALLVLLPAVLPPVALTVAVGTGAAPAAIGIATAVAAKVLAVQAVRRRLTPQVPRRFIAEYLADWLLPLQSAMALLLPRRIVWRGRTMRIVRGRLS